MFDFKFDSHVHILPAGRLKGLMRWMHNLFPGHPVKPDITADDIIADLERCGIKSFFNLVYPLHECETDPLNRWNLDFSARFPQSKPVCSLHIDTPHKHDVARNLFLNGSCGIKFHPFIQKFDPSAPEFESLYSCMDEMGMPLFLHTGYDAWYGMSFPPARIESIIRKHPRMPVVLVHMIFPLLKEAFVIMENNDQVYLDATNVPGSFVFAREKGMEIHDLCEQFIEGTGRFSERIMYGSDYPVGMGSLERIMGDLSDIGFGDTIIGNLAGGAAGRLYAKAQENRSKIL